MRMPEIAALNVWNLGTGCTETANWYRFCKLNVVLCLL